MTINRTTENELGVAANVRVRIRVSRVRVGVRFGIRA